MAAGAGMTVPILRPYQSDAIQGLRDAFRQGFMAPLLVMPTGAGKTVCFSYLSARLREAGKRVVILVHREELIEQVSATLQAFDVPHGLISAGAPYDRRYVVHVASVFTLARRLDRVEVPDYAICDEAHHAIAGSSWGNVIAHWREQRLTCRLIGVTATPERLSGEGLGSVFDTMVLGPTTGELIELGALAPYRLFGPQRAVDLSGVGRVAGEFARAASAAVMDKPAIVGDSIGIYRKHCDGAPSVAFCVSVEHAQHVADNFRAAGYRAQSIDGKMDRATRRAVVQDFRAGRLNLLTSCALISEGFDVPGIVASFFLNPTWSLAKYLQECGRALRPMAGKPHAYLFDQVGNHERHGLPDDPRAWSLLGREDAKGRKKRDADDPACRQCPACYAVSPAAAARCRDCGEAFPVVARKVDERDGELSEIEVARARTEARVDQASAQTLEDLVMLGTRRGMKNPRGWARHILQAREAKAAMRAAGRADGSMGDQRGVA